jgi:2-polyprenyl-6-methoxyphenol hydroxylase-like FAD-dependent oxidoreductase
MCADIVIVGGGPVGLWTAIQLKKRRPGLDVQVYERYEEYQRSHVLRLQKSSLLFYSDSARDANEEAFYKDVTGKRLKTSFQKAAGSVYVRTHDLEKALKNYAQRLGVKLTYDTVQSPAVLMAKHPECRYFVAADGAHSRMRAALQGENAVDEYPLQYVIELKYQAKGRAGKLGSLDEAYKTNKLLKHMAFEYVGREKDGVTPVTVRFFLDKKTYDALPQAGFKDPLSPDDARLPRELAKDIRTYMTVRKAHAGETYLEGSGKVSKLTLSMYAAKKFALQENGKNWFFVGDAAMGIPYFRALNSGLIVGSQLALILTRQLPDKAKIAAYSTMRPLNIGWEFTAARAKDTGLNAYDMFRRASAAVPWEMNKWDANEAAVFFGEELRPEKPKRRQVSRRKPE